MIRSNYVKDMLNGEALPYDIDAYVSFWHESGLQQSLQAFLGFTDYEYDRWMKEGDFVVRDILYCRRKGIKLEEYEKNKARDEQTGVLEALKKYRVSA